MKSNDNNQNNAQQSAAQQDNNAMASGNNAEKTFTQDEVNRIVSERLAREREKNATQQQPTETEQREFELGKRENKMSCKEFIFDNKYPEGLLDIFDTDDFEGFKNSVDKLFKAFPQLKEKTAGYIRMNGGAGHEPLGSTAGENRLADIFKN